MAEIHHHNESAPREGGIGAVGIVAIIILVLVGLFLLLRWLPGTGGQNTPAPAADVNVTVPTPDGGGAEGGAQ